MVLAARSAAGEGRRGKAGVRKRSGRGQGGAGQRSCMSVGGGGWLQIGRGARGALSGAQPGPSEC